MITAEQEAVQTGGEASETTLFFGEQLKYEILENEYEGIILDLSSRTNYTPLATEFQGVSPESGMVQLAATIPGRLTDFMGLGFILDENVTQHMLILVDRVQMVSPKEIQTPENLYFNQVSRIPGVTALSQWVADGVIHLWAAVAKEDREAEHQIYEIESEILDKYTKDFDFFVMTGSAAELHDSVPTNAIVKFLPWNKQDEGRKT